MDDAGVFFRCLFHSLLKRIRVVYLVRLENWSGGEVKEELKRQSLSMLFTQIQKAQITLPAHGIPCTPYHLVRVKYSGTGTW